MSILMNFLQPLSKHFYLKQMIEVNMSQGYAIYGYIFTYVSAVVFWRCIYNKGTGGTMKPIQQSIFFVPISHLKRLTCSLISFRKVHIEICNISLFKFPSLHQFPISGNFQYFLYSSVQNLHARLH